jgi:hypothetical protein
VSVERRPVHRLIATAARPGGVAAAVAEARLMADEDLVSVERVAVGASGRRMSDHFPVVVCRRSPSTTRAYARRLTRVLKPTTTQPNAGGSIFLCVGVIGCGTNRRQDEKKGPKNQSPTPLLHP